MREVKNLGEDTPANVFGCGNCGTRTWFECIGKDDDDPATGHIGTGGFIYKCEWCDFLIDSNEPPYCAEWANSPRW